MPMPAWHFDIGSMWRVIEVNGEKFIEAVQDPIKRQAVRFAPGDSVGYRRPQGMYLPEEYSKTGHVLDISSAAGSYRVQWDGDPEPQSITEHSQDDDRISRIDGGGGVRRNATVYPDQPNTAFTGPSSEYTRSQQQAVPEDGSENLIDGLFQEDPEEEDERQGNNVPSGMANSLRSPGVTGQPLSSFGK